jgi:hypothetical protein
MTNHTTPTTGTTTGHHAMTTTDHTPAIVTAPDAADARPSRPLAEWSHDRGGIMGAACGARVRSLLKIADDGHHADAICPACGVLVGVTLDRVVMLHAATLAADHAAAMTTAPADALAGDSMATLWARRRADARRGRRADAAARDAVSAAAAATAASCWHACDACGADYHDADHADGRARLCATCDGTDDDAAAWRDDAGTMTDDDDANHAAAHAWSLRHDDRGAARVGAVLAMLAAVVLALAALTACATPATTPTTAPATTTPDAAGVCDDHGVSVCGAVRVTLEHDGAATVHDSRGLVHDGAPVTYHTTTDETGTPPAVVEYLPRCAVVPVVDAAPDDGARDGVRVVGVAVGALTPATVVEYDTAAAVIGARHADGARCVIAVVPVALY